MMNIKAGSSIGHGMLIRMYATSGSDNWCNYLNKNHHANWEQRNICLGNHNSVDHYF